MNSTYETPTGCSGFNRCQEVLPGRVQLALSLQDELAGFPHGAFSAVLAGTPVRGVIHGGSGVSHGAVELLRQLRPDLKDISGPRVSGKVVLSGDLLEPEKFQLATVKVTEGEVEKTP